MKIKNDLGIDWIIAGWLASNTYTGSNSDSYISASSFCRSVRQNVLGRLIEKSGEEDPIDISTMLKASTGTALHRDIQAVWENPVIITEALKSLGYTDTQIKNIHINPSEPVDGTNLWFEKRATREIGDWTVTGQFDLVVDDTIHDFKSTSVYTYINKTKEEDYKIQLSIYRWLNRELIKNDIGIIHYIFTDWNKINVYSTDGYPNHPFVSININLMSLDETEEFIKKRIRDIDYYTENLNELPLCDDHHLMISKETWQYFTSATSSKAYRNFDTKLEALKYMQSKGGKGIVKQKQLEPVGCKYCNCCSKCNQYKSFIQNGILKDDRRIS